LGGSGTSPWRLRCLWLDEPADHGGFDPLDPERELVVNEFRTLRRDIALRAAVDDLKTQLGETEAVVRRINRQVSAAGPNLSNQVQAIWDMVTEIHRAVT
jgi:hypothetical protein